MKKIALIFVLTSVLSISVIADEGQIPIGGRSCPSGQTCLTASGDTETKDNPILKNLFDLLNFIFG